jgi:hypothetical protein
MSNPIFAASFTNLPNESSSIAYSVIVLPVETKISKSWYNLIFFSKRVSGISKGITL